jgi:DNA-binding transcriptional MerR regulator/methylmalonyl-CoA mutase cobalamin-binding subunit
MEHKHPIKAVSLKTGLSPHVIRVWERRYKAVEPVRTPTNRRLYSDEDIERLYLLRKATQAGESIGQIAKLSTMELRKLVNSEGPAIPRAEPESEPEEMASPDQYLHASLEAVKGLDAEGLESQLLKASANLSKPILLEKVLEPLMYKIGDFWRDGTLTTAHEHLASAVVRSFLGNMASYDHAAQNAPVIVATSPAGQYHEFGALMASITASSIGWRAIYLGPNIPAEEIARAVRQSQAQAVALSIIYPLDDPRVGQEIVKLHRLLDDNVVLFVGGQGAAGYKQIIDSIGAVHLENLAMFQNRLESIRAARSVQQG